jgi:nucleotide-binding universal stress UspA family protein
MTTRHAPVVVSVEDPTEDPTDDVVAWAAAEAAASGSPLRLVHAFRGPMSTDALGLLLPLDCLPAPQLAAARTLEAAVTRAREVAPDIDVRCRMYQGSATRALLRESRAARLLVVGSRSGGRLRRFLGAFVDDPAPARLAASAGCPVAVVPRLPRKATGRPPPHVLVGVDATASSAAAVGFAFRAASRRGIALTAVHAWTADAPADLEGVAACRITTEASALWLLDRALEPWPAGFPDVAVTARVTCGDAASALVTASDGAALVVIGAGSRRSRLGTRAGSVSRSVVGHATAPVMIVGSEGRGTAVGRLDLSGRRGC